MKISYCIRCEKGFYPEKKWYDLCERCFKIEKNQEVAVECVSCGMFTWRIPSKSHYPLCRSCWYQSYKPRETTFEKVNWEKIKSEKIPIDCPKCGMITWKRPHVTSKGSCKFCTEYRLVQDSKPKESQNEIPFRGQTFLRILGVVLFIIVSFYLLKNVFD